MSETHLAVLIAGGGVAAGVAALLACLVLRGRTGGARRPSPPRDDALQERIDAMKSLLLRADRHIAQLRELSRDPEAEPVAPASAERSSEVRRLAETGASPERIAERTGIDVGEVELLLNLQRAGERV